MLSIVSSINERPNHKKRSKLLFPFLCSFILFGIGTIYCLHYGRIGYMPQDHAAVFDGGYRILSGQIPFRDFTQSNALVPIILQAFLFKLFGVTWFIYCLHAALLNGLFCILAFLFLRLFGAGFRLSFFYALLSGVIFYPPFGIPVQDQHAYFFTFLLIYLTGLAIREAKPVNKKILCFLLPTIAMIAFLSKQIPTLFGIALAGVLVITAERRNLAGWLGPLLAGSLFAILALWACCLALGIDYKLVNIYFFQLPAETGKERIARVLTYNFFNTVRYMYWHWRLFFPFVFVATLLGGVLIAAGVRLGRPNNRSKSIGSKTKEWCADHFFPLLLAPSFLLICFCFVLLTNNQIENGVPLMFISMGLAHLFLQTLLQARFSGSTRPKNLFRKTGLLLVPVFLYGSSFWCAWNFDRRVNATRMVNDIYQTENHRVESIQEMPAGMEFLVWAVPKKYPCTPGDLVRVVNFFHSHEGNFYLIGDSSILYGLTKRPSVNPILWFHPGQTLPFPESTFFAGFQDRLLQALKTYQVRYIVLEFFKNRQVPLYSTWSGVTLDYFPALNELVQQRGHVSEKFGPFTIIELDGPFQTEFAEPPK